MGDSSGGQPSNSEKTELKVLIVTFKERHKEMYPNDDRWPCPFCLVVANTNIQCNIHIAKDHPNVPKTSKKGFFSQVENQQSVKTVRQRLTRKCKNRSSPQPSIEETFNDLTKFLKIIEEEYTEFNDLVENPRNEQQAQESHSYEFAKNRSNINQGNVLKGPCPHCPPSLANKLYKLPNGLKIHCKKIHPEVTLSNIFDNDASTITIDSIAEKLTFMKKNLNVLKRIPKGARLLAAHNLSDVIDTCVKKNDLKSWCDLLFFSYAANTGQKVKIELSNSNSEEKYQRPSTTKCKTYECNETNLFI